MAGAVDERGQATIEFVVIVAVLLVLVAGLAQLVLAGYALWSAADAARAGARAAHVGGDPRAAARSALPGWLERGVRIDSTGPIEVDVAAPALLPGVPDLRLGAAAALDPGGGGA